MHFAAVLLLCAAAGLGAKPRLIVLTDIGGDPDDTQSMVRLMTYVNEFDIEGLVASASGTPGELRRSVVQPALIRQVVEAYGKVRPNLVRHAAGYPDERELLARIKPGDPDRSVANLGPKSDTEGSRWIVAAVDRKDPRPVNIAIWGGAHDLAQALWSVRHTRTPAETRRFVAKLRVHSIGHQDATGPWILENFPELFFILSSVDRGDVLGARAGAVDRRLSVYRGMYLGGDESLTSREWIVRNVSDSHGPLGALYPLKTWTAPNPHGALKEGDTPSWFYFLPNGIGDPGHPEWGSWGGRFVRVRGNFYNDAPEGRASVFRWREAYQNDFAARMDWCSGANANRPPAAVLNGSPGVEPVRLTARPGQAVRLDARGSSDPDGQPLRYRWRHYPEPGGQSSPLRIDGADGPRASFVMPDGAGAEVHVILEVSDNGEPPLRAWRRAVVTARPTR